MTEREQLAPRRNAVLALGEAHELAVERQAPIAKFLTASTAEVRSVKLFTHQAIVATEPCPVSRGSAPLCGSDATLRAMAREHTVEASATSSADPAAIWALLAA